MSHKAAFTLRFDSPEEAARMAASLAPDDDGHLAVRQDGSTLVLEAASDAPLGLLRTVDEALAVLTAARKASRLAAEG